MAGLQQKSQSRIRLFTTTRAMISCLSIASVASLVVTLFLSITADNDMHKHKNDARSFQAPHLQQRNNAPSPPKITAEGSMPRRNLSDVVDGGKISQKESAPQQTKKPPRPFVSNGGKKSTHRPKQALQQTQEQEKQKGPEEQKNKRPSGVVYEYIPPPPINMTARSLLPAQYPNLADFDAASTSTALCAIVKDAEPYLDEWVDYHIGLGFHTIYLIDNSKDHELESWQNKRRAAGHSVRVMPKPGTNRQMYSYHMCAAEHKDDHKHMAFFDVDEFLVLKKHTTIDKMLAQHLHKGSLAISWYIFGTGSTTAYAPLPVTKRFLYRDGVEKHDRHDRWGNVKSIMKTSDYGGYPQSPHSIKTNRKTAGSDKSWTDTNGKGNFDKIGALNYDRPVDVAVIHHYKYLSPKEFYWKSCVRKTVDDKFKDCESGAKTKKLYNGRIRDDSAWQTLKKNVPKYAMYDQFEDFM